MVSVAVWSAAASSMPRRLTPAPLETEAALEEWVKADPALVRDGLVIVAQQLIFSTRERLDLLCIENRSRWLVVELKRDRLAREVAAQALDYVSLLAAMDAAELAARLGPHLAKVSEDTRELVQALIADESEDSPREVAAAIVGISADEPLLRITRFLTEQYDVPISVVELQSFRSPSGDLLILREETGGDVETQSSESGKPAVSLDERWARVSASADAAGCGPALEQVRRILEQAPVYLRPYARSVMIAPAANRSRYLGVVGFGRGADGGRAELGYGADAIHEFFPTLAPDLIREALGPHRITANAADLVDFAESLAVLLASVGDA